MSLTGIAAPEDAMTEFHEEILNFFQVQPMNIADKLLSKYLITEEVYEKIFVQDSDVNKARQMALNVKRKIRNNPQYFKVFLEVLRNYYDAISLVTKLEKSVFLEPSISVAKDIATDPSAAISLSKMSYEQPQSDESKYVDAYQHFIQTKDVLEMLFLKLLFSGPPRLGKTTTRRRLIGEILNLISANKSNSVQPSTGVVESGPDIIVKCLFSGAIAVDEVDWSILETLTDEARTLFQMLVQSKKAKDDATNSASVKDTTNPAVVPHIVDLFKKASAQPKFWGSIQHLFRAYLRIEDTGGQPELMDMLPAFTIGPGLYLLFVNLEWNLKEKFKLYYQHKLGMTTIPEESHITLEEMLLSTLSSISCSCASANHLRSDEVNNNSDLSEILESSNPVVCLLGTHKDKVTEEQISKLDTDLQAVIRGTDFFDKGLVRFWSDGKLIVPVDNMSGVVEELKEIKLFLEAAMEKHFKKLKIPAVWLFFSLCFRETDGRTASIERAFSLSSEFNMSVEETKVALWFLHHHAGVLMYFPNIPLLEDLVILDNQIVYDSVTFLILRALSFKNVGQAHAEKFRETGQFVLKDLIASKSLVPGGEYIPPEKLIALLEFLHIIVPIHKLQDSHVSREGLDIVYLMPCVLRNASEETLEAICSDQSCPQFIAPLMIRFKCGFVPLGIFQAFIACLISNQHFSLVEKKMKKNMFQFRFEPLQFLVSFLCYSQFYAVVISEESIAEYESHKECVAIRLQVVEALQQVSSHINYGYLFEYDFAFECPIHPGKDHLCVVGNQFEATKIMKRLQHHNDRKPVRMESIHTVWFGEPQTMYSETVGATKVNITEMPDLKYGTIMRLFRDKFPASDAKKLGTYLDISSAKLQELKQNNSSDAEGFLLDTINYWLEKDTEKSWTKLAEAVEDCGHKLLAEEARSIESVSPCAR